MDGKKKKKILTPLCIYRECPTCEHVYHFGNSKHQAIEEDVAVTPLKILPSTHKSNLTRFVPLSVCVPLIGLTNRVQNQIALTSSKRRRYTENFITIG